MYLVIDGEETHEYPTREAAVEAAKELSAESFGKVEVQDENGRESMVYRRGSLDSYVYETRDRRR